MSNKEVINYTKWNNALLEYYFKNKSCQEAILNIDISTLNKIGEEKRLGNYESFINAVVDLNSDQKGMVYDHYSKRTNRPIEINKLIQNKSVFTFAQALNNLHTNTSHKTPYLNYIGLAVLAESLRNGNGFYQSLNALITNVNKSHPKISSNNLEPIESLFRDLEKNYPNFINRQIGSHRFVGLIKYQVVLNNEETQQLESILYKNHIVASEETTFLEILNKLLPFIPNRTSLRKKVLGARKDRAYATFFLNKVRGFDDENYAIKTPNVAPQEKAKFAFAFKLDGEASLHLLTNLSESSPDNREDKFETFLNDEFIINLDQNRLSNGYSPIAVETTIPIDFNCSYRVEETNFVITSMSIDKVNFFQKTDYGYFLQTKTPKPNTDTFIVVENNKKEIKNFETWKVKQKNATNVSQKFTNDITKKLFGDNWVVYSCNQHNSSINNNYYEDNENVIQDLQFKSKDIDLDVMIFGGYKIKGQQKTYLDIALPSFKVEYPDFDVSKFKLIINESVKRVSSFKEIDWFYENGIIHLHYNNDDYHLENDHYTLVFEYQDNKKHKFVKSFEFSVVKSVMAPIDEQEFFKLNTWGKSSDSNKKYYNGITLKSQSKNKEITNSRNLLGVDLSNEVSQNNLNSDYFINLLAGKFHKSQKEVISRQNFNKVIEHSAAYFESHQIILEQNKYSNYNLIHNLIALGYINKQVDRESDNELFQINPPTFIKIERAFITGGSQLYKLVGARTKYFTQKLLWYCNENDLKVRWLHAVNEADYELELCLLPRQVFIEGFNIEKFKQWVKDESIEGEMAFYYENKHHIGDSLLRFISSVKDFEDEWIDKNKLIEITDANYYSMPKRDSFPRIRETNKPSGNPPRKHKVLELKQDYILKLNLKHWMEYYVRYKHNEIVMVMDRPRDNKGRPCYDHDAEISQLTSAVYFYKYYPLPSLFYKALVSINHTLPQTKKVFIVNSPLPEKDKSFAYNDFFEFKLSGQIERRREIARIITGERNLINNPQIGIMDKESSFKMYFHYGAKLSSDFDVFTTLVNTKEEIIAFTSLKNKVYIVASYLDCKPKLKISLSNKDTIEYNVVELKIKENINHILSLIITSFGDKDKLKGLITDSTIDKTLSYNTAEEVLIKKYNKQN